MRLLGRNRGYELQNLEAAAIRKAFEKRTSAPHRIGMLEGGEVEKNTLCKLTFRAI